MYMCTCIICYNHFPQLCKGRQGKKKTARPKQTVSFSSMKQEKENYAPHNEEKESKKSIAKLWYMVPHHDFLCTHSAFT